MIISIAKIQNKDDNIIINMNIIFTSMVIAIAKIQNKDGHIVIYTQFECIFSQAERWNLNTEIRLCLLLYTVYLVQQEESTSH